LNYNLLHVLNVRKVRLQKSTRKRFKKSTYVHMKKTDIDTNI